MLCKGDQESPCHSDRGRLGGQQDNYKAEFRALLQALRATNPASDLDIYIDNHAVVQRWGKHYTDSPRERTKASGRAVWNRIENLKSLREKAGSATQVQWVKAHITGEEEPTARRQGVGKENNNT